MQTGIHSMGIVTDKLSLLSLNHLPFPHILNASLLKYALLLKDSGRHTWWHIRIYILNKRERFTVVFRHCFIVFISLFPVYADSACFIVYCVSARH